MSDHRYRTARWQRLRKAVLNRDHGICQIRGPRCALNATTVHHIIPSSQRPDLFWSAQNLAAACTRCNYGHGSKTASENKTAKIERLAARVHEQDERIAELLEQLARYERDHAVPGST